MTPFDIWAPILKAPFSGDVTQEIAPALIASNIKGIAEIEHRVVTEVASYGSQLSKILDALQLLAVKTGTDLAEIDALVAEIQTVKTSAKEAIRRDAETALARLKTIDEPAWRTMVTNAT